MSLTQARGVRRPQNFSNGQLENPYFASYSCQGAPDTCISQIPVHQVNGIQSRVGELATSKGIRHGFPGKRPRPNPRFAEGKASESWWSLLLCLYPTQQSNIRAPDLNLQPQQPRALQVLVALPSL